MQELDQVLKVVQWITRHEELSVVLDEVRAVFLNIEPSPSNLRVFSLFSILAICVSTAMDNVSLLVGLGASLTFFFALIVSLCLYELLSSSEVSADLFIARNATLFLDPWVLVHLLHGGSVGGVQSHH